MPNGKPMKTKEKIFTEKMKINGTVNWNADRHQKSQSLFYSDMPNQADAVSE